MLIEFFGRNFGSFRDEFHLSMLATDIDPGNDRGVLHVPIEGEEEPLRLLRCAAIYGPNASGKSNLLRAANALKFLIGASGSFASDKPIHPYEPFLLDDKSCRNPVMLGLRAVVDTRLYEYMIEFNREEFLREELAQIGPKQDQHLFVRSKTAVSGPWTSHKQFELLTESFRQNALLLSLADRLAPAIAGGLATGFVKLLDFHNQTIGPYSWFAHEYAAQAAREPTFANWLVSLLQGADTGIVDCEVVRAPRASERDQHEVRSPTQAERMRQPSRPKYRLQFFHAGTEGAARIPYWRESLGTRKIVELAPIVHELIFGDERRAYFVDEIAASIHPVLLEAMIRRFNCEGKPESVRGQLIFATHETTLLDAEAKDALLRRDQIYLTDKDASGASRLYSVAEFKERNNLNLRRRYLHGRYGALPAVGSLGD